MRVLMLGEFVDLDVLSAFDYVASNQSFSRKLHQEGFAFDPAHPEVRVKLDLFGVILKPPFPVCHHPEHGKEEVCLNGTLEQVLVSAKSRLDVSCSHNFCLTFLPNYVLEWHHPENLPEL
jgi:hypothetical protein